jgi:hypothetical protein
MPYAHNVNRVTIFGSMYGGAEIWSTGFYLGLPDGDAPIPSEASAQAVKDAWATFFGAGANMFSYIWKTEGVKIAHVNKADGKTSGVPVTSYFTTAPEGGSPQIGFPPQVSVVATLLADNGKGLGGKGRMYLPGIAQGLDATGHMGSPFNQTLATNLAGMFDSIAASFDAPGQLINASQGRDTGVAQGWVNRPVTHIRVGNVYDTQRRRRNGLTESYATEELGA